nr:reverse transcriptase domain-containing protein [Tanacetum cinerariifolium]
MQSPPPPAQIYSPPKKDLSWTRLPEFVDDTVTDYSRPTPSIDASKCNKSELQSSKFSVSEHGESSDSIMSKPMIKFVKEADCPRVIKTNNTENARKSTVKYAEMYRNISKDNISYLSDYEPFDGGYVSFGQGGDNKNSVMFTDSECIVLGRDFKLIDDTNVLLRTPRQHNMYSIDLNNIVQHKDLTCLVAKASADEECIVLGRDFKLVDDTNVLLRTPRQHNMYSIDLNNIVQHKDLTCLVAKASTDEGYHQIKMAKEDEEKTAFITSQGIFCYSKMSFELKEARSTYQCLVDKAFQKQIGQNLEVYVEDLVIKSCTEEEVIRDIEETFKTIREINMKLYPKKCTFGMREGTLLRYKVNPDGLKTAEAETVFKQMKKSIAELPMLTTLKEKEELTIYLIAAKEVVSAVLMTKRDGKQMPIYFVSRALQGPKINYTPMEKLILALVHCPVPRNPQQNLTPITSPWPFYKWGIDITGPFSEGPGKVKFLIVAIDYFTKWTEAKPVATITGAQIKKFLWENIVCRFGLLGEIISKNEEQFKDNPFKDWCKKLCICQCFTSVKHPQANGLVERANMSLGEGIKARLDKRSKNWPEEIESNDPSGDWHANLEAVEVDVIKNDKALGVSLELLEEKIEQAAIQEARIKSKMEKYYNVRVYNTSFRLGDLVYQNNKASHTEDGGKLGPKWEGPYEVTKAFGKGAYKLRDRNRNTLPLTWNIYNLKKCYMHEM